MQRLKIIFAGTPEFAAQHLQALLDHSPHKVVAVFTQPDRPSGRGKKLAASPVKNLAVDKQLPLFQPLSFKDKTAQCQLAELNADIMVVVAYGLILPKSVLTLPPLGCINVHASLLPRWRGAAPIQRAIEAGDEQSGVTIMQMDEGLDTGPMLSRAICPVSAIDTALSLQDKLAALGSDALLETLDVFADPGRTLVAEPQDDTQATYAHKISKAEAQVDWRLSASTLASKVRAFNPAPIAFTTIGKDSLRIWQANAVECEHENTPGTIISCDAKGILVACDRDALLLSEVQLAGKKRVAVSDLLQGRAALFLPGTRLGS